MIIRGVSLTGRMAVFFAFLLALAACGGSGGSGDNFFEGSDGSDQLSLRLYDPQGNETDTVTTSAPGTLLVKVNGSGGDVVVNATTTIGTIFPASGTALTNSDGVATFQLEAGVEKGAGTVTATAQQESGNASGTLSFQVGEKGLRMGFFDADGMFVENQIRIEPGSTLSAGGNAQLSVVILDKDGERVTTAEDVRFNSGCIAGGQAVINPVNPVGAANGEASTLYTATGCAGNDDITASLVGAAAQAFATLSVAAPTANAVNFVSAEPQLIVLRGTGGANRDETADVTFTVIDGSGQPLQGVKVDFDLSTDIGGLSLSNDSALSDGEGQVKVTVSSGDIATTVRVIATADDGDGNPVSTTSDLLIVTTGLPDQNSISLSVTEGFIVETAFNTDGIVRTINVRMADKFNNPVVDGTSAVFTTEYGSIVGSCTTTAGACSVQWESQEPRLPTLTGGTYVEQIGVGNSCPCPGDMGYTRGGRSTIIVRAQGEESFVDRNGNGIMDQDEKDLFDNLPEAFIDHNEDGVYTPALALCQSSPNSSQCIAGQEELFFDFNNNEVYDLNDSPAVYNGLLCPPEGDGVWCSRDLIEVRAQAVVTLSFPFTWTFTQSGSTTYMSDQFNNPPAAGSTIKFETLDIDGATCEIVGTDSFEVPNIISFGTNGAYGVTASTSGWGLYEVVLTPKSEPPVSSFPIACAGGAVDPNGP